MNIDIDLDALEFLIAKAYEKGSLSVANEEYFCNDELSISMRSEDYAEGIIVHLERIMKR